MQAIWYVILIPILLSLLVPPSALGHQTKSSESHLAGHQTDIAVAQVRESGSKRLVERLSELRNDRLLTILAHAAFRASPSTIPARPGHDPGAASELSRSRLSLPLLC